MFSSFSGGGGCLHLRDHYIVTQSCVLNKQERDQGLVVQRPISTNPGLNFNQCFFIFLYLRAFYRIIFPILLDHLIIKLWTKRNKLNFLLNYQI